MHAQSLMDASPNAAAPCVPEDNPLRGRFTWVGLDAWIARDSEVGGDVACALLTPNGPPAELAKQAMQGLAEEFGMNPHHAVPTYLPDNVYATLTERDGDQWVTLHIGEDFRLRRPVNARWRQLAASRGWVRVVIGYRAKDADIAEGLDDLSGHDVTAADVLVQDRG